MQGGHCACSALRASRDTPAQCPRAAPQAPPSAWAKSLADPGHIARFRQAILPTLRLDRVGFSDSDNKMQQQRTRNAFVGSPVERIEDFPLPSRSRPVRRRHRSRRSSPRCDPAQLRRTRAHPRHRCRRRPRAARRARRHHRGRHRRHRFRGFRCGRNPRRRSSRSSNRSLPTARSAMSGSRSRSCWLKAPAPPRMRSTPSRSTSSPSPRSWTAPPPEETTSCCSKLQAATSR